jgi:hypothetical protein
MAMRKAKSFTLTNQGGFVCDIHCIYYDDQGRKKGDVPNHENFPLGQTRTMNLKEKISALEPGNMVQMKVWVEAGSDNTFGQMFEYDPNGDDLKFVISGTTLDNHLGLEN